MFYEHFRFYGFLYVIVGLHLLIFSPDRRKWDIFTRIVSTYNAVQCVVSVTTVWLMEWWSPQYYPITHIYYVPSENAINALHSFAAYLLIDGFFQIAVTTEWSPNDILMLLHHLLGCWGIWTLAELRMGYFLAFYFALTELSTPALNWSWWNRDKQSFQIFFILFVTSRILTLPWLWNYLSDNSIYIGYHPWLQQFLAYGASATIAFLNIVWTIGLTVKLTGISNSL